MEDLVKLKQEIEFWETTLALLEKESPLRFKEINAATNAFISRKAKYVLISSLGFNVYKLAARVYKQDYISLGWLSLGYETCFLNIADYFQKHIPAFLKEPLFTSDQKTTSVFEKHSGQINIEKALSLLLFIDRFAPSAISAHINQLPQEAAFLFYISKQKLNSAPAIENHLNLENAKELKTILYKEVATSNNVDTLLILFSKNNYELFLNCFQLLVYSPTNALAFSGKTALLNLTYVLLDKKTYFREFSGLCSVIQNSAIKFSWSEIYSSSAWSGKIGNSWNSSLSSSIYKCVLLYHKRANHTKELNWWLEELDNLFDEIVTSKSKEEFKKGVVLLCH